MRWVAASLLPLLVLALPALATPAPTVEFLAPAQADGRLAAAGAGWALLLFEGGPGGFDVALEGGGTATNRTLLKAQATPAGHFDDTRGSAGPPRALPGPVAGHLALQGARWSSLYLEADSLGLAAQAPARLGRAGEADAADTHLPAPEGAEGAYRMAAHPVPAGPWLAAHASPGEAMRVTLQATGVRRLEWHNATLDCLGSGPCPSVGPSRTFGAVPAAALHVLTFLDLEVPGGVLSGGADATAFVLGGTGLDLEIEGTLRLPQARLQGDCGGPCPPAEGRTLLAEGPSALVGLAPHPSDPRRMQARLDGAFAARLDEGPPFAMGAGAVAAAAGLALAIPVAVKALVALFARSSRPPPLRHPRRQTLYDLVRAEPGLSFRAIQRRLAWPNGILSNHMARLLEAGLVTRRRHRNTVRFFESHGRFEQTWGAVVALRDPRLRALHEWVRAHPSVGQGEVLRHAGAAWGWRRSTTQDRLRALEEGGLLGKLRQGRAVHYVAQGQTEAPAAGAAAWPAPVTA